MEADDDLTTAYLTGFHKRDDEVRILREKIAELERLVKEALGILVAVREAPEYRLMSIPAQMAFDDLLARMGGGDGI